MGPLEFKQPLESEHLQEKMREEVLLLLTTYLSGHTSVLMILYANDLVQV